MIEPLLKIYAGNLSSEEKQWNHICKNQIRGLQDFQPPTVSEKIAAPPEELCWFTSQQYGRIVKSCLAKRMLELSICITRRAGNKILLGTKRVNTGNVASIFPCIILKGQFKSAQGLIKQPPKVTGRGACISCRGCWYSRFSGMAQPGFWHSYIESCLQYSTELEFSLAWSVSTFTPTVLKEFPICFFPLIREPLEHNRAFWDVQQALKFYWVRRGAGYFDPLGRQPSTSQMKLQAGQ